jgi:hypothetical protein
MAERATLEDLIRWLALPYQDGEPIFSAAALTSDLMPVGREIEFGDSMRDLYREVVGTSGDPVPGIWRECPCCGRWSVDNSQSSPQDIHNQTTG